MNKALLTKVVFIAGTIAAIAAFQRNVMTIPVVGTYLPS